MPIYVKIQSNEYNFSHLKAHLSVIFIKWIASFLFLSLGNIHWAYILWQTRNEMLLKFEIPTEKKHEDVTIFCNNLNVFFFTIKFSDIAAKINS